MQAGDPGAGHFFDPEGEVAEGDEVALLGEAAEADRDQAAGGGDAFLGEGFADEFGKFVEGQGAVEVPGGGTGLGEEGFFLIEFVLNLADDFFEDIFKGHEAEGVAVFVHDDGEMELTLLEELEDFFEAGGFGDVDDFAGDAGEVGAGAGEVAVGEEVLDVDDAEGLVEVAVFAEGEAGIASAFGDVEAFGDGGVGVEGDYFATRAHDFAGDAVAEVEGVEDDVAAEGSGAGVHLAGGEHEAEFVLGVGGGFVSGLDAEETEEGEGAFVEEPDEGVGEGVEPLEGIGDPQGGGEGVADAEGFGGLFAGDDVEEGDDSKADGEGDGMLEARGGDGEPVIDGLEEGFEDGFADPAEGEAGEGDAELGGAEIGVEVGDDVAKEFGPAIAAGNEGLKLGVADFDEGEFGGDEEAVHQHQGDDGDDLEEEQDEGGGVHATGSLHRTWHGGCPGG